MNNEAYLKKDIQNLKDRIDVHLPNTDSHVRQSVDALVSAIENRRVSFAIEPWHEIRGAGKQSYRPVRMMDRKRVFANEMLMRAQDETYAPLELGVAFQALGRKELAPVFDLTVLNMALTQARAEGNWPVSVNVSVHSVVDLAFWRQAGPLMSDLDPDRVVFEILESDYIPSGEEIRNLKTVRNMGYRFALDDVTLCGHDKDRMRAFAGIADYIKIDGKEIARWKKGMSNDSALIAFVGAIRNRMPEVCLIAEWVDSIELANRLAKIGIDGAQGRDLPTSRDQFALFLQNWNMRRQTAARVGSCTALSLSFILAQAAATPSGLLS